MSSKIKTVLCVFVVVVLTACGGGDGGSPVESGPTPGTIDLPPNEGPAGSIVRAILEDAETGMAELVDKFVTPNEDLYEAEDLTLAHILSGASAEALAEARSTIDALLAGRTITTDVILDTSGNTGNVTIDANMLEVYERFLVYVQQELMNAAGPSASIVSKTSVIAFSQTACERINNFGDVLTYASYALGTLCLATSANVALPIIDEATACGALALNQSVNDYITSVNLLCQVLPIYVDEVRDHEYVEYFYNFGVMFEEPCLRQMSPQQTEPDQMRIDVYAVLANKIDLLQDFELLLSELIDNQLNRVAGIPEALQGWLAERAAEALMRFVESQAEAIGKPIPTSVNPIQLEMIIPDDIIEWIATPNIVTFEGNTVRSTWERGTTAITGLIPARKTRQENPIAIDAGPVLLSGPPELLDENFPTSLSGYDLFSATYRDIDKDIYYAFVNHEDVQNGDVVFLGEHFFGDQTQEEMFFNIKIEMRQVEYSGFNIAQIYVRDKCGNNLFNEYSYTYAPNCWENATTQTEDCLSNTIKISTEAVGFIKSRDALYNPEIRHDKTWYDSLGSDSWFPISRFRYR